MEQARLLAFRDQPAEAVALLEAVLADDPVQVAALLLLADIRVDARDLEGAIALGERATAAAPRSAEAWNTLARALHAAGRNPEALSAAETARGMLGEGDNFRHFTAVVLTIVWCLRDQRRYREALAEAEAALARMPDAVLAQWAGIVEEEGEAAEQERC